MTLEEQIRRMGDARAAEVTTPSWRDRVGGGGRRWPVMVAAAALVAVLAGITVTLGPDDEKPGADVATEPETTRVTTTMTDATTSTVTTGPVTTTAGSAQQTVPCAVNPVPSDDVLDLAAHIAFDRTPLDLDQDGVDDEMLIYDDADGHWFLLARLHTGWTNALDIGTPPTPPGLAQTSDGVPAGTDLDGDGQLEFFVTGYLGPSARLVTLQGCELIDSFFVDEPAEGLGASFGVQIGFSDATPLCQGRACATRVRCSDGVLTQELLVGIAASEAVRGWGAGEIRLDQDGVITTTELPTRTVGPFDDPPTEATTGVVDCTP